MKKEELLLLLKQSGGVCYLPSVYDCVSLKAAELCGMKAAVLSQPALSLSLHGMQDFGLVTLDETMWVTEHITQTANLPLIVDMGEGFGRPFSIYHAARRLAKSGASGLVISDRGRRWSGMSDDGREALIRDQKIAKVRAAALGAEESGALVIAKITVESEDFLTKAVEAAKAYTQAGADAVILTNLSGFGKDLDAHYAMLKAFAEATPGILKGYERDPHSSLPVDFHTVSESGYAFIVLDYMTEMSATFMSYAGEHLYRDGTNVVVSKMKEEFKDSADLYGRVSSHFGMKDHKWLDLETRIYGEDYKYLDYQTARRSHRIVKTWDPDPIGGED